MVWQHVKTLKDGVDLLNAETLNAPLIQLAARTEYLRSLMATVSSRTNMAVVDAALSVGDGVERPRLGQAVYRVAGGNSYAQAAAVVGDVGESKWFWADHQAMAVGIVGSDPGDGATATVVLGGYIAFGTGIPVADVIVDDSPTSGRYFLSTVPGKLTAAPSGPIIYVCDCEIRGGKVMSMLVSPQYRDTGESHIHRAFVLSGRPVGYAVQEAVGGGGADGRYRVSGITPSNYEPNPAALPGNTVTVVPLGHWSGTDDVTYTLGLIRTGGTDGSSAWGDYKLRWSVDGGTTWTVENGVSLADGDKLTASPVVIGQYGLMVDLVKAGTVVPGDLVDATWTVAMPDAAQAWLDLFDGNGDPVGFRLNLGMYPEMARFVPPLPANGAELTVDGVELRGAEFGARKRWEIVSGVADATGLQRDLADTGGPWLLWYGGAVSGVSYTAPFAWADTVAGQGERDIVLHANRMRVGPTGFVTSLQAAPGSPLKVTSVQTGARAFQGALQLNLDIDFKSAAGNAEGHEVVKRIEGSTFVTGPVVEKIVAGPGLSVDRQQGVVTVSASNAVYAGDFETIALKNAKQDLVGGVFPYTKLLGWRTGSMANVNSGFTAKFRVPDHIPYGDYYVVVSASVFGEESSAVAATAAFRLTGYSLADQACSPDASLSGFDNTAARPGGGYAEVVRVPFSAGYEAFDPVLVHGFRNSVDIAGPGSLVLQDTDQRVSVPTLWLKGGADSHMVLRPGYFVGVAIERCGFSGADTPYEAALGFLSLRWNLVAVA